MKKVVVLSGAGVSAESGINLTTPISKKYIISINTAWNTPASEDLAPLEMLAEVLAIAPVAGKPPIQAEPIFAKP